MDSPLHCPWLQSTFRYASPHIAQLSHRDNKEVLYGSPTVQFLISQIIRKLLNQCLIYEVIRMRV